jgi:hypothetical protein
LWGIIHKTHSCMKVAWFMWLSRFCRGLNKFTISFGWGRIWDMFIRLLSWVTRNIGGYFTMVTSTRLAHTNKCTVKKVLVGPLNSHMLFTHIAHISCGSTVRSAYCYHRDGHEPLNKRLVDD